VEILFLIVVEANFQCCCRLDRPTVMLETCLSLLTMDRPPTYDRVAAHHDRCHRFREGPADFSCGDACHTLAKFGSLCVGH